MARARTGMTPMRSDSGLAVLRRALVSAATCSGSRSKAKAAGCAASSTCRCDPRRCGRPQRPRRKRPASPVPAETGEDLLAQCREFLRSELRAGPQDRRRSSIDIQRGAGELRDRFDPGDEADRAARKDLRRLAEDAVLRIPDDRRAATISSRRMRPRSRRCSPRLTERSARADRACRRSSSPPASLLPTRSKRPPQPPALPACAAPTRSRLERADRHRRLERPLSRVGRPRRRSGATCATARTASPRSRKERWDWRDYYSDDRSAGRPPLQQVGRLHRGRRRVRSAVLQHLAARGRARSIRRSGCSCSTRGWRSRTRATRARACRPRATTIGRPGRRLRRRDVRRVPAVRRRASAGSAGLRQLASIANRVSYVLNLHGPSMTLDTMCSSSLTAIHLACQDLKLGPHRPGHRRRRQRQHPSRTSTCMLSAGQFISSDGQCQSFGEGGDGYVPGEGVGAVVLKPLPTPSATATTSTA